MTSGTIKPVDVDELSLQVLEQAARVVAADASGAVLIRNGSNAVFRLGGGIVARVGRAGRGAVAEREVRIARWLADLGLAVNRPLTGFPQPTMVAGRPVTWWAAIPAHRSGSPAELGGVLRVFHALPTPRFALPAHDPFEGLDGAAARAATVGAAERRWWDAHVARLREEFARVGSQGPVQVIHGDAWQGNLAVVDGQPPILLDFEKVATGHRGWDLVQLAVDHTDFGRIDAAAYQSFVDAYGGDDVTEWPTFRHYSAIQELRWVAFVMVKASASPKARTEVHHRLACLRGEVPKPWTWNAF